MSRAVTTIAASTVAATKVAATTVTAMTFRRRESSAEARPHDRPRPERKPMDADCEARPRCEDLPKSREPMDEASADATADLKTESTATVDADAPAAPAEATADVSAEAAAELLILPALLADADVAATGDKAPAAPLPLADQAPETETEAMPGPVQGPGEPGRGHGVGRAVSGAVHAVIAAAEKGAAKDGSAIAASGEEAPSSDQHLGPQVSLAAKAAVDGAGKGLALGLAAKLAQNAAPAREATPDFQFADLKPADAAAPQSPTNGANAAPSSADAAREAGATSDVKTRQPLVRDVPLGAVPIEIGMRAMAGIRRFEIRLDPADLGRIDVRLDMGDDGIVKAHLTVDKVETLALLQRDARTLERAFEQAGLKPSDGGVDLTLRDHAFAGHRQGGDGGERPARQIVQPFAVDASDAPAARVLWRGSAGLDMLV